MGVNGLGFQVTQGEQGGLNKVGINCIRSFPGRGIRIWGARTLSSDPEWRYINVRRLFNYIAESIMEGTQWSVFEPNDERLWMQLRIAASNFLTRTWREGALFGATPEQAFFVKCDAETNPPDVIEAGQVICEIGIAPVKPAEFVVFRLSQFSAGAPRSSSSPLRSKGLENDMASAQKPRPTNHFRLNVGGKEAIGQFREVTGLDTESEIIEQKEVDANGQPGDRQGPGQHEVVEHRAQARHRHRQGPVGVAPRWSRTRARTRARTDCTLELLDYDGSAIATYTIKQAWPVKYTGVSMNAGSNEVAVEGITLAHEGFKRM